MPKVYKAPMAGLLAATFIALQFGIGSVSYAEQLKSTVTAIPESLLVARRAKHDPALNMMTYQHMDNIFGTQKVTSKSPTPLAEGKLWKPDQVKFTIDGVTYGLDAAMELMRVNSLVVLRDGKLVFESYRNGADKDTKQIVYSISKSITATLLGIAVEKGLIASIDDTVDKYLPELKDTAYAGVPIKTLLTMQSGTDWKEIYTEGSELYVHRDRSLNMQELYYEDYAPNIKKLTTPGEKFNYSTLDTQIVGWLLDKVLGGKFSEFMSEVLWTPAGMENDGYWVEEGPLTAPRPFYGGGFTATPRDLARFTQIMLDQGESNGVKIVSPEWAKLMTTPQGGLDFYGYFWWMMPRGAFSGSGVYGQANYADPETNTVVVINSYWPVATGDVWEKRQQQFIDSILKME